MSDGPIFTNAPGSLDAVRQLGQRNSREWDTIFKAEAFSSNKIEVMRRALHPVFEDFPDTTVLAFGSLARLETTSGSDVDWAVVHNGPASERVRFLPDEVAHRVGDLPSESSEFGKLSSSLEIITSVASKKDSRLSLSRRMLLIFESVALAGTGVRDSLIKEVLSVYHAEETLSNHSMFYTPRYLMNDLNQFWRLMCTDYSGKTRAKTGKQWGLRSIKLNFSRKLLFVAGVLRCFEYHLEHAAGTRPEKGPRQSLPEIYERLYRVLEQRPLETLAKNLDEATAVMALDIYDEFLSVLDDPEKRDRLSRLKYEDADDDELLQHLWNLSRTFHDGIVDGILAEPRFHALVRGCLVV